MRRGDFGNLAKYTDSIRRYIMDGCRVRTDTYRITCPEDGFVIAARDSNKNLGGSWCKFLSKSFSHTLSMLSNNIEQDELSRTILEYLSQLDVFGISSGMMRKQMDVF